MTKMKITDETLSGVSLNTMNLYFEENQINLSQLIATRVSIELESFSQKEENSTYTLLESSKFQTFQSDTKASKGEEYALYVSQNIKIALDAFRNNQFMVFINDHQVDNLDATFLLDEIEKVSFIKLTPLVGG